MIDPNAPPENGQPNQVQGFQTPGFDEAAQTLEQGNAEEGVVDQDGVRRFPDGSVVIHKREKQRSPQMDADDHDQNLAEILDEQTLSTIGNHLKELIEEDKRSQEQFFQSVADLINLLGIKSIDKATEDSTGEPEVHSSALFETLLDYVATIMASIFPSKGPVDSVILGESTPQLEDVAYRKTQFFNAYLLRIDKGFDKELKRAVVWSVIAGSIYCKVYIDSILGRPTARMIKPEDFIINSDVSSHLSANRKTQVHRMDEREFDLHKMMGDYRDIDVLPSNLSGEDENVIKEQLDEISGYNSSTISNKDRNKYEIYESHVDYRIEEDPAAKDIDIPIPYIITLDSKSAKVLRIQRNWKKEDFLKKKREYYVNFSLLPSLSGEGYGLVHYAGTMAQAATVITRQLIKAGMYSNFPGGVYQAGLRLENNTLRPAPGEFLPIQTGGVPIQQSIQALPYKEPSSALNDLKNQIEDSIRKPSAIVNQKISEMVSRAPMGSVLAMLENLQKVPNFVNQGYHKAFENMLELFNERFGEWLPNDKPYPFHVPGGKHVIMRSDFDSDIQVIPSSDPSLQNSTYRFMRAEIILNNARQNPEIHDLRYANEMFYKNLDLDMEEIHKLIKPAEEEEAPVIPLDPISENMNLLKGKPVKAGIDQDHDAHMLVHGLLKTNPLVGNDQNVQGAIDAHLKEHEALKILINFQAATGFEMPEDPSQIPPEVQNQIAIMAAQQAQQQGQAEAGEQQQNPELLTAQALMKEVEVKELQTNLKAEIDNRRLSLDQQRLEIDYEKMVSDNKIKEQELQIKLASVQDKHDTDEKKMGVDLLTKSQGLMNSPEMQGMEEIPS